MSFAQAEDAMKKKVARRERFPGGMALVVPWPRLVGVIQPPYPKGARGRRARGIGRRRRIYFLQPWHGLADAAREEAICASQARRTFAGLDLSVEAVPDATTRLNFRHLPEAPDPTRRLFAEVGALPEERKLLMKEGTMVDATVSAAPSSTKNARKERAADLPQTGKGHPWSFGMKAPLGAGAQSGLVPRSSGPAASVADGARRQAFLHGQEKESFCRCGLLWR